MAIREQQLEFQDIQLRETRAQLEEANRQHQSMVEAMKRQAEELNQKDDREEAGAGVAGSESPSKSERLQTRIEDLKN